MRIGSSYFSPTGLKAAAFHEASTFGIPYRLVFVNEFCTARPGAASDNGRLAQLELIAAGRTSICVELVQLLKIDHNFLF